MKKNTFIMLLAICLSLLMTSCLELLAKEIKGNGKLVTKSIKISDFTKVEIETCTVIDYSQGKNNGTLEMTVDGNLWEYYDVHTKGEVLYIKLKEEYKRNTHPKPTKCLLSISSENLSSIDLAGSSTFNFCTPFSSDELNIDLAGSGKVLAINHSLSIDEAKIDIAGSGEVQLVGSIMKAVVEIAGSGKVNALDCEISQLKVDIAGSGIVEAHVVNKLDTDIAGSGKVNYKGNPQQVNSDIAGSGKVKKL